MNRVTQALVEARFALARRRPVGATAARRTRRAVQRAARSEQRLRNAAAASDLRHFERSRFSQNGEDGVIAELARRVGAQRRTFIEIGASDGRQNCTRALLQDGWSGVWVEGDPAAAAAAQEIAAERPVTVVEGFVDRDNAAELLRDAGTGADEQADVLVVDVDGNDWWIWRSLSEAGLRPSIVVVEYNPSLGRRLDWRLPHDAGHRWDGSARYGASLQAFAALGRRLGYALVHCDTTGTNAFFVRRELATGALAPGSVREQFAAGQHVQGAPAFGRADVLDAAPIGDGVALTLDRIFGSAPGPGAPIHLTAWVHNNSDVTIGSPATAPVQLAWRWDGGGSEPQRAVAPPWRLASGEGTLLGCRVLAPPQSGTHHLELALVQEGVRWLPVPGRLSLPIEVAGKPAARARPLARARA